MWRADDSCLIMSEGCEDEEMSVRCWTQEGLQTEEALVK